MTHKRRRNRIAATHNKRERTSKTLPAKARLLPFGKIVALVNSAKRKGLRVVTTNGCFDILHIGHLRNLEYAKRLGDILIVGINSDASVRRIKGRNRPIVPERERAEIVASLRPVDATFIFDDDTPEKWLAKLKPQVHVKGSDRESRQIPEKNTVEKFGGKLVLVPLVKGRSTTNLIAKIRSVK